MTDTSQRARNALLIRVTGKNITSNIARCDNALSTLRKNKSLSIRSQKQICRTLTSELSMLKDTINNVLYNQSSHNKLFAVGNTAYVAQRLRNAKIIPEEYKDAVAKCGIKRSHEYNLRESPRLIDMLRKVGSIDLCDWINSPLQKREVLLQV
mmetsp:Transcript_22407/g.25825  ORF Transcript_22407/g.25825 Transcript_22407/m.25825 type:complete len:153 (+) Transcript_22407:115-573(+)